jgi:two-component system chemotaxis response regulator CheY
MRVLVVDDSPTMRALVKMHLRRSGHEAFFVENGHEAAEWVRANGAPNVILLDVNMPIMNGLEFLERRAKLGVPTTVPVVIVSTEGKPEDIDRGIAAGAKEYLRKPFTGPDLDRVLARVMEPT